ncbi:MAG: NAD-glutamate dehydrogenase, partial [Arenimonas sp.]
LRINSEHPYELDIDDGRVVIQDFEVEPLTGKVDVDSARARFEDAFAAMWRGDAESDGFNRLVLAAGLGWRQVAMLRGYCKYLQQTGVTFSQAYMEETLVRYPLVARLLVELFEARFEPGRDIKADPKTCDALRVSLTAIVPVDQRHELATILEEMGADRALDRSAQIDACGDALAITLEKVSSLDEDRILRAFKTAINATLRTSYFQKKGDGGTHRDYISFKFDPAALPELPKPRPYREIFVYSPFVEGVHLRFGPVARGGLRWSDRREDFRTEVLGLVKAQMVKNTVIVPVGSKGGFFVKRSPVGGDRDAVLAEGIACYKRFINALLDITDNLVDGKVVHPVDVVRHDNDDPYLVVAADKGTATFSDIANGISAEHGYWLGDAFASGGSVGYDHKGMGITAKGAWESVKRHFRAIGRDCQTQEFTVVGIGDMSGDVFGNGMLLSQHIRLLAAFDHRHIFLDPNPDAAISFAERDRMFKLPRSSWDDYDRKLISAGGGIYPRSAKTIPLTPEVKAALHIDADVDQMPPSDLMNAILKAPVDLLWNGGIGTYVKAASESHAEVGDRANNSLRVNGHDLRCRMVGEGGNLGMTQRGRIEAAHNGVLLNTDFIDNSAGVDTSDHEVNIKILLGDIVKRGELSMEQRNSLLASMTDEVGELVLNDNYRQNQAISLMEAMSAPRLGSFGHFIRTLEAQGLLDRAIEFLPSDAELSDRKSRGQGLTRPELSVLLSYDKIVIYNQMLDSDVPEDPHLSKELVRYFPKALQQRYSADMENHHLRREIIATAVTNSMVNRMGATFLQRLQEDTGETPAQIAKAYSISREVLDARTFWSGIDELDLKVTEAAQIAALTALWHLQRNMTRWLLNRPAENLVIASMVERYSAPMKALREALPQILPADSRASLHADVELWQKQGFPVELALGLACLPYLTYGLDIVEVALERKLPVADVGLVYFALSDALHSKWLMDNVEKLPVDGRWHAQARGVLRDELQAQQRLLVGNVLATAGNGAKPEALVRQWLARDDAALKYTLNMFGDMRNLRSMDFATLSVAVRRLAQIAATNARTS